MGCGINPVWETLGIKTDAQWEAYVTRRKELRKVQELLKHYEPGTRRHTALTRVADQLTALLDKES